MTIKIAEREVLNVIGRAGAFCGGPGQCASIAA